MKNALSNQTILKKRTPDLRDTLLQTKQYTKIAVALISYISTIKKTYLCQRCNTYLDDHLLWLGSLIFGGVYMDKKNIIKFPILFINLQKQILEGIFIVLLSIPFIKKEN